ncbi:MAG: LLM class F420-dependent oxidoreductase [bacterium TMED88]|nr:LLM class F420-dependent oxidoreductase [Deltaproteobacteria bacterium]OUV34042.1 MAG: LLM class F420-dependent oxidoreductase [bacterium TMED88]
MSLPMAGVPLHAHEDWLKEMVDLGYTDFWSSEANGHDGFSPLALAAAWAPTARLGIAIIPAFTRGPAVMAQSVASLADAAPGRFVMGIGTSSNVIVEQWNGIPFERPYYRTRDMVRFLRRALSGEKITEEFETFNVRGFRSGVKLEHQPKILVAALREGMLKMAGREADGAILNWLSAEDVRQVVPHVHAGGEGKEIVARLFVLPVEDRAMALAIGRRAVAAYLNVPVYAAFHEWLGRGDELEGMWSKWKEGDRAAALEAIPEEVVDALIINGSPGACRDHIQRYVECGVDTPALAVLHSEDLRQTVRDLAPR